MLSELMEQVNRKAAAQGDRAAANWQLSGTGKPGSDELVMPKLRSEALPQQDS